MSYKILNQIYTESLHNPVVMNKLEIHLQFSSFIYDKPRQYENYQRDCQFSQRIR